MDYSKLVAVTGLPGLFELINSKTDGAIVRSLEDNSTRFVSSRIHNFSQLESIEVYTVKDNVNLVDIFHSMEKGSDKLPDEKDGAAVKKYFEKVYPDLDFERVYSSDLKKMVKWFSVLKKHNIEIKLSEIPEEPEEETLPAPIIPEEKTAVKEKKKPVAAKKAAVSESSKKEVEEKPVKKKATGKKK
jgi:Domain of unknown function (DUF5606)